MIVNEVVTKFSFKGSLKPQENFNANLKSGIKLLSGLGAAIATSGALISRWASQRLANADPLAQLSKETSVAIGRIQELGFVASVSGSSSEALQGTIRSLSKTIGDASRGVGSGAVEFSRLGISVRDTQGRLKSADTMLDEVRRRFNQLGLTMDQKRSIAASLGIDQSLIQMLSRTDAQIAQMTKTARDLGTMTEKDANQLIAFNDSVTTLRFGLGSLQDRIALGLSPALGDIVERFTDFLVANKDLISNGIGKVAEGVTVLTGTIIRLSPLLIGLMAIFKGKAILLAFLNPITLIAAGIAAVLLVIDDLIVGLNGGKSVVADFFQEWLGWDILTPLRDVLSFITDQMLPAIKDFFGAIPGAVKSIFGGDVSVSAIPTPAAAMATSGGTGNVRNSTVSQANTINISTPDPVRAGQVAADTLQQQLTDADRIARRGGI
jgi:hypothetical protein